MTNLKYIPEEPICAIATALAPGAIGIVRTSGSGCIELLSALFSRPQALKNAQANSLVYGWIVDGNKNKIDQVMVGIYRAPKSFTGEDMAEIFCHGGIKVVTEIHNLLLKNGFRQAERGEFTFRSFINGKTDLTRAEAVKEIIDSKTSKSCSKAAGRLSGSLLEEIDSIKKLVVDTIAEIEVGIEYPEDEENISETFDDSKLNESKKRLSDLCESWKSEKIFQDGAKIVLCGKTNAGKSSLFNALLKEDRAIVSSIEGTTRDWLESWADFEGIPVRLFDTAGLRKTEDKIEELGVALAKDLSGESDAILYAVDSTKGIFADDAEFLNGRPEIPKILVWNKCDDENSKNLDEEVAKFNLKNSCRAFVKTSAKKNSGLQEIIKSVKNILCGADEKKEFSASLGSERQKQSVQEALERVEHALEISRSGEYGLDAVVQDLEDALDSLGEVTGEVTADDVLSSIFSNFCVGK